MGDVVVGIAVLVQAVLAVLFVVAAVVALRFGDAAQRAAESEVVRQGLPADLLVRHRIRFAESTAEAALPLGIAVVLGVLAVLNAAGVEEGRAATWVAQSVLLIAGGLVTAGQVFADRYVTRVLDRADDAAGIDSRAVVAAARARFPRWLPVLVASRFVLVTAGSVLVLVLVSLPIASGHYG